MRLIKTLDEIKGIKKANQIIAKIYTDIIPPYLKPGVTTREIDRIIDEYIRSCGARPACIGVEGFYSPFPAATCISVNEEVVHGISREIGIEAAVVGNRLGDLGHAVQSYVEKNGFSVVRDFAGHGVGLDLHEEPMIPNYGRRGRGLKIENGMVLAIEPMVNVGTYKVAIMPDGWTIVTRDGKRSAHFEHSVAIIDGKAVILSELD